MFCTLSVQVCVSETAQSFHLPRGFMVLVETAVCPVTSSQEISFCDGLKSCSGLIITLLTAILESYQVCLLMPLAMRRSQRGKKHGELLFHWFCIICGEILTAPSVISVFFLSRINGRAEQCKTSLLLYHTI